MLHALLGVVVKNTKADVTGKRHDAPKEIAAIKRLLKSFLGRKPTEAEINLIRADNFPVDRPNKCCIH